MQFKCSAWSCTLWSISVSIRIGKELEIMPNLLRERQWRFSADAMAQSISFTGLEFQSGSLSLLKELKTILIRLELDCWDKKDERIVVAISEKSDI
jgi:hypothetical protein